jgi:hypothetical protein
LWLVENTEAKFLVVHCDERPERIGSANVLMKDYKLPWLQLWFFSLVFAACSAPAQVFINEILFNPPGTDAPNEYIELRGTPNLVLPAGTYLVSVQGDTNSNPGAIRNVFDLSGRSIGGNGFLALMQKASTYSAHPNASVLMNTNSGPGWGDGPSSSVGHRGDSDRTDLINASVTFLLIQSGTPPSLDGDLDADNDGTPDGDMFASWTVLDGVGVLDNDGLGDIAYGLINFRRNPNATATTGTIVPVGFVPSYVGRNGNSTGWSASEWVASDNLGGTAPNWTLGSTANTVPTNRAGTALNHIGAPNFGAPAIPGVVVIQSGGSMVVAEAGATDSYTIALNTSPNGRVTIQITANPQLQISTDGGTTYGSTRNLSFTNTLAKTVLVRAVDDTAVESSPHLGYISHAITSGTVDYPITSLLPTIPAYITDNEVVLLSELKVNPPGPDDQPFEFIELRGTPGASLNNIYLLVIEGDSDSDPGVTDLVVNLSSTTLGSNGLLLIAANANPYTISVGTTVIHDAQLDQPGGALGNGSISFLLVSSPAEINEGEDLDAGDNGILEELPDGASILDAVAWSDGDTNDVLYGGVVLPRVAGTPDAATRFLSNNVPRSVEAWFYGNLAGADGDSLIYSSNVSSNFPAGTDLSPGSYNNTAPRISPLAPLSGVIGDPTNPNVNFTVDDDETPPIALTVTATSSNASVIPDANLIVTAGAGGQRTLQLNPVGVGYSTITVLVSDGTTIGQASFPYAASAMGRPGGRFHTGAADASAAIAIDSNLMFVGDDENQVLRMYQRNQSGAPVWQIDCNPFLGLTDIENGRPREVDIEASTRVGNRIFWIGAHSHANIGEGRTNRSRVFATDISGTGASSTLTYVGRYDYLKLDLVNWDVTNGHGKGSNYYGFLASSAEGVEPKAPNGFNIEGLSMAPGSSTTAYIGFRAPIVPATNRTYALIVPVLNFTTLATNNGPPGAAVFGPPIELELSGRGIRSLEGTSTNYLIVAGPPGETNAGLPNDFKLYTWTGNPAAAPQQRSADLTGMNPEAIVQLPPAPWTSSTAFQLLSDLGRADLYNDGTQAKLLSERAFKKFRSDVVNLGAIEKAAPYIISASMSESGTTITWRALAGETYSVQFKSELGNSSWTDLTGNVTATGPVATKLDASIPTQRFYRVVLLP